MIGLIVVAHQKLGQAYLDLVAHFFANQSLENVHVVGVGDSDNHETVMNNIHTILIQYENALILTDIFGATPSNAALKLLPKAKNNVLLLTGLNAPMLVKAVHYAAKKDNLRDYAACVYQAGQEGILLLPQESNDEPPFQAA